MNTTDGINLADRITSALKGLREDGAVVLRILYDGDVRVFHGILKGKGALPSIITDTGLLLHIRPIMYVGGRAHRFSSLTRDHGKWN